MRREICEALPAIYDATASDEEWPVALDKIAVAVGARSVQLTANDLVGLPFQMLTTGRSIEGKNDFFESFFGEFGHFEQRGIELMKNNPAQAICRCVDAWPDQEATFNRDDYACLRSNLGIQSRAAVHLREGQGWLDTLYMQLETPWSQVSPTYYSDVKLLLPHVAKAVEISRVLGLLRNRHQSALGALDHVGIGMCIADERGRSIVVNAEAKRIFEAGDGIAISRSGDFVTRHDTVALNIRAGIDTAVRTANGEGSSEASSFICPRSTNATPYLIEICPLRDRKAELDTKFVGALICIIDPDSMKEISSSNLTILFGLSGSESYVCDGLLAGLTANDIADNRNVSPETVRSQIKSLYGKAGVNNRAELIRLALSIKPPIAQSIAGIKNVTSGGGSASQRGRARCWEKERRPPIMRRRRMALSPPRHMAPSHLECRPDIRREFATIRALTSAAARGIESRGRLVWQGRFPAPGPLETTPMNSVKTPLAALVVTIVLSTFAAGCSAISQDGGGDGAAPSEQSYAVPPPPPSEDKES